ncbi:precorrin-6Y C5,15-methyltransferase subunit CbiT [Oscillatoria sp. CS-180]|uniref:precorrin-6Y C5,15-methyltransferase subunit CbiT n=1 Tax=Oscillatoria sp. CS-180 TaxID=3021720 RepID=UPI00232B084B|nr:precorrin-6Y C5,15-methyltransferase subunit CbiT [Oscillatoria sp. CS-180]MDB9528908.1 precorrin-6Y C5,15-methyltransferase subunit CbiT [Oscillatoria sp. CS-180]
MAPLWPYATPGIPDHFFEQLPGIPISKREVRLLIVGALRLQPNAQLWDIGAGTGTLVVEAALLCPQGRMIAVERDTEVANLIRHNCDRFELANVDVVEGVAPDCLAELPSNPDCILVEGGKSIKDIVKVAWNYLASGGRLVVTTGTLETLYSVSEAFAELCVRNVEIAQPVINRLETRGHQQVFKAINPIFILSGEKVD